MPRMNLAGVLANPDFVDSTLTCTRSTQSVDSTGIASNAQTVTPFSGVVAGGKGTTLRREGEGARVTGGIQIFTSFTLRDGRSGGDADVVAWCGRQYTVVNVQDYSTYGFVAADCELIPLGGG
jgi:galactose-6-phosphate isomerase